MCIIYTVREVQISIHALREEGDICFRVSNPLYVNFYPRPPRGGRPISTTASTELLRHFYPRPPRGGRPLSSPSRYPHQYFYPRPPRGGRHASQRAGGILLVISIHALREEGDDGSAYDAAFQILFLSTPSARRATENCSCP